MTAEEIRKLPPRYFLTEAEEATIPSREELHLRYLSLPEAVLANLEEVNCPSQEELLGSVFKNNELQVFLKGQELAYAMLNDLSGEDSDGEAWKAILDYVWKRCFRRKDIEDIYAWPSRHRIGKDLF